MPATRPRILIVKTSSLGDVIHALPVASDIARALPGARIDWVVESPFADVPALHPAVRRVIPSAIRRWRKNLLSPITYGEIWGFKSLLAKDEYSHIVDLQGLLKSAWICRQARGTRHGYDRDSAREPLASLAYRRRHAVSTERHAVERNRELAARALGYTLDGLPLDYGIGPRLSGLQEIGGNATSATRPTRPLAVLLTATSRDDKLWPETDWLALGRWLEGRGIAAILPAGHSLERQRAERIAGGLAEARVLPPSGIAELAAAFRGAAIAIGVDTGLTHLACALGIPTIALYTATDPGLTGVVGANFHRNLGGRDASPSLAAVIAAAEAALAPVSSPTPDAVPAPRSSPTPASC